jgi:hypothetical protein
MTINWGQVWDYLYGNRVAIGGGAMLTLTAAIKTAPEPISTLGKWIYDFSHQVFNITNTRLNTTPTLTPPATNEEAATHPTPPPAK